MKESANYITIEDNSLSKAVFAVIAVVQGGVLATLYQSLEHNFWPGTSHPWLTFFVTLFIALPSLFLLLADKNDYKKVVFYLSPFVLLISVLGAFVSDQISGFRYVEDTYVIFSFTMLVACFKASIYVKPIASNTEINYPLLYRLSWRHAVIFAETALFTGIFFAILFLGAELFDLLGIELFKRFLDKSYIVIPLITLASAFAIRVFKQLFKVTDSIITIIQTLLKFLLIVLVFVSLGFLVTLPFTGLEKLWATRSGSFFVLWLMLLILLFANSVFYGQGSPYSKWLNRFVTTGIA
ncbi:MAG: hypothetical protein V2I33_11365, partial [Kangiellaceae bacterium]|nr:hypothetical protein [Kangiellaceae bacterium]